MDVPYCCIYTVNLAVCTVWLTLAQPPFKTPKNLDFRPIHQHTKSLHCNNTGLVVRANIEVRWRYCHVTDHQTLLPRKDHRQISRAYTLPLTVYHAIVGKLFVGMVPFQILVSKESSYR